MRVDISIPSFVPRPEHKILDELQLPLAAGRVRYVGEAVAMVVAESPSPPATPPRRSRSTTRSCPRSAMSPRRFQPGRRRSGRPLPDNLALDTAFGDRAAVEAAIAGAHVVIEQTIRNQRTASAFMEPRSAIGRYDEAEDQYVLISGCQGVHRVRHPLAGCLKVPQERVRVICPDVGGGFGSRTNLYPEQVAVVWAARRVGRR